LGSSRICDCDNCLVTLRLADSQRFTFAGAVDMFCGYAMAIGSVRASRRLFSSLYSALMHAPMLFFDSTPRGRILNRVANDVACIDRVLPFTVRSMINCILAGFASLFVVTFATPWFLVSIIPLVVGYYYIQVTCCCVSRAAACKCLSRY